MPTENIGDDSAPGISNTYASDYIYYNLVTTNNAGTVTSINIYLHTTESGPVKCAIYTGSAGSVGSKVADSETGEETLSSDTGWIQFTFSTNPSVSASTTYWIACWADFTGNYYDRGKGAGGTNNWGFESAAYDGWPASGNPDGYQGFSDMDAYMVVEYGGEAYIPKIIMIN